MPMTPVVMLAQEVEAPDRAVIGTDAKGAIIYWGEGARQMYGWTAEEVLGKVIVDITPTELSRELAAQIMETLKGGHPWSGEFQVRGKNGVRFDARVTDVPVHDKSGDLLGIVGISRRKDHLDH